MLRGDPGPGPVVVDEVTAADRAAGAVVDPHGQLCVHPPGMLAPQVSCDWSTLAQEPVAGRPTCWVRAHGPGVDVEEVPGVDVEEVPEVITRRSSPGCRRRTTRRRRTGRRRR